MTFGYNFLSFMSADFSAFFIRLSIIKRKMCEKINYFNVVLWDESGFGE